VDGSLATAISKVRKVLGNDSVVVTVPQVGYWLDVPVDVKTAVGARIGWSEPRPGGMPGRPQWMLTQRLGLLPSSDVWLANNRRTHEIRVFKFVPSLRLNGLRREVTLSRLLHG
jgi:non-specific serine/threonine protein kinase